MKFITSFCYTFGTKLISLILLLTSRILTARILGPADLGSLGSALNFMTIISRWGSLGTAPATQFVSSKFPQQRHTLFIYAILFSFLLGIGNLLFLIYFKSEILNWQFVSDVNGKYVFLKFIPWLPLIMLSMTLPVLLLGAGKIRKYSLTQILPILTQTIVILLAFYLPKSFNLIILAQLTCWVSTVIISLFLIDYKSFRFRFDKDLLRIHAKYSVNAWPQVILQFGIARFAVLIGSQYLTTENLGYYILASNVSESFLVLNSSFTPLIFNSIASKGADFQLLHRSLRFSNLSLLFLFLCTVIVGKPLLIFFFGSRFDQSWNLLLLLLVSVLFHGMIKISFNYLGALGKNRAVAGIQIIQLSVLFGTGIFAGKIFGVMGLCYAVISASFAGFFCCMKVLQKMEKEDFKILSLFKINKNDVRNLIGILRNNRNS